MNISIVLVLRAMGLLFSLQQKPREGQALSALADALEAGRNVDDHMQRVADAIKAGNVRAFEAIAAELDYEQARLAEAAGQGPQA